MRIKIWLSLIILLLVSNISFPFSFDAEINELPMYVVGYDATDRPFYTFFNVANLKVIINTSDDLGMTFRIKDTYLYITNTNKLYVDRMNVKFQSDKFSFTIGRAVFKQGNGMLIGNVSDGFSARTSFLNMNQKLFAMYSGFLPEDINQFNVNTMDEISGSQRLTSGLVLEKPGLLINSFSGQFIYSMDLSTNAMKYNPFYINLAGQFLSGSIFTLGMNLTYALGSYGTNQTISAYGGSIQAIFLFNKARTLGLEAQLSFASGDDAGGSFNRLQTFGVFDTGFVLTPDFANMFMAKLGLNGSFLDEKMQLNLDYYHFIRPTVGDSIDGYYDGTGSTIGQEISGSFVYQFDPNWSLYLYGGYFIKGNAFAEMNNIHKVITGVKITL